MFFNLQPVLKLGSPRGLGSPTECSFPLQFLVSDGDKSAGKDEVFLMRLKYTHFSHSTKQLESVQLESKTVLRLKQTFDDNFHFSGWIICFKFADGFVL